jgi:hypothetical protein
MGHIQPRIFLVLGLSCPDIVGADHLVEGDKVSFNISDLRTGKPRAATVTVIQ